jgi:hypothetical protein
MVDRAHGAWTNGYIQDVHHMVINVTFPCVPKGRLINLMMVRKMDRDYIQLTESILSERMVEIIIEGNAM